MGIEDKSLQCRECGAAFIWTVGEQEFYQEKGLVNEPTRCPDCRAAKRKMRNDSRNGGTRIQYPVTCAECGKETTVPFVPRNEKPVYCSDCFDRMRTGGAAAAA